MDIQFRYLKDGDFESWEELWQEYTKGDVVDISSKDLFTRLLNPEIKSFCLLSELNGEVVGFLIYITHPYSYSRNEVCYIDELYVVESMR